MHKKLSLDKLFSITAVGLTGAPRARVSLATAEQILSRQVETVADTTPATLITSAVITLVIAVSLMGQTDPLMLTLWVGGMTAALAALAATAFAMRLEGFKDVSRSRFWARTLDVVSVLRAAAWGACMLVFFPHAEPGVHLFLGPPIAATMFGGVFALSALPSSAMLFIVVLGGSSFVAFLMDDSTAAHGLAVMALAFMAYLLFAAVNQARFFVSHALAEIENDEQRQTIGLLLNEFQDNSSDWLWHTNAEGRFVEPSTRFAGAAGLSVNELAGQHFEDLFAPPFGDVATTAIERFARHEPLNSQQVVLSVDGERRIWSLTAGPRFDEEGVFHGYRGVASDVTELRAATEQLETLAHYDQLTGLTNRASFMAELTNAFAADGAASIGIILFDLTGFKQVNDTLGHGVGDELLARLGERLRGLGDADRQFARLGGDEFALLVKAHPRSEDLVTAAREVLSLFSIPFAIGPHNVVVDASAGIALGERDGADAVSLMRAADLALYAAKSSGRGRWREYDRVMASAYLRRQNLESGLRNAVANNEVSLRFQPIVHVRDGSVAAFEALVRWDSPEFGAVSPGEFIPIAEECGIIVPLGEWILREAVAACASFPDDIQICVNVSPVQLRNRKFATTVRRILREHNLPPERLVVEITEGVFLETSAQTDRMLNDLLAHGVQLALDDFGTGYSSLSYLRQVPFSSVKIDKSFIADAAAGGPSASIIKAIVDLAQAFEFSVVVEGVETHQQLAANVQLGCDYVQGFLFSKPMLRSELPAYLDGTLADRRATLADVA